MSEPVIALHAVEVSRDEYERTIAALAALDSKAQGAVSISGIFLAAAFAVARDVQVGLSSLEQLLLGIAVTALAASVSLAIAALKVRRVRYPPAGKELVALLRGMEGRTPGVQEQDLRTFHYDVSDAYTRATEDAREILLLKGKRVSSAHTLLAAGAFTVTVGTILQLVG